MKEPTLIMIHGKSETGKSTVAEILERRLREVECYNVIRCSLSTWIRETLKNDFFWDGVMTPESRKCMAEIYRVGTDFYPYHMARRVWERDNVPNLSEDKKTIVIVESFREKVNYDYFDSLWKQGLIEDIVTVTIERPGVAETAQELTSHQSETDLDDFVFDYLIVNKGTLQDLENKVVRYVLSHVLDEEMYIMTLVK